MRSNSSGDSAAEILKRDPELQPHLDALGLKTVEEYQMWCAQHGFSTRLDKHWRDRCRERSFGAQDAIKDRLARKKGEKRKPRQTIQRIFDGELDSSRLTQPHLLLIHRTAVSINDDLTRTAFRSLLLHIEGQSGLLTTQPAHPQFGTQEGNTFIEGLLGLALQASHWVRSYQSWKPRSHNVRRQFSSLASHLLAAFPVPSFMNSVWFMGRSEEAVRRQEWYKAIANGHSPRCLDLPVQLTKRMVRHFLRAPKHYSVDAALRWGQVMGLGGDVRLVEVILGSRIGTDFGNNDFWITVIRWLIQNPMLDPAQISPLIDFIHRQKFERQEFVVGPGEVDLRPPDPGFSMKGRTVGSLLRQMHEWHARLRKEPEKPQLEWSESGIGEFDWTEGNLDSNNHRRWTIVELRSRKELYEEGRMMRHCVASYDNSCAFGGTSIWSMGVERNLGRRKRSLTLEVANQSKAICQIRGKANRLPNQKEMNIVQRWASQEGLSISSHIRILR
jgi:hypothetical protein